MATIRKRGEYSYEVQIRRRGYPSICQTFEYRANAEKWARRIESELERGLWCDSSAAESTTVAELIKRFQEEYAPFHYRQREDKKEAWRFQCARLSAGLGKYSLAVLDRKHVVKYRDDRLKEVGEATVRKELFMLSKILRFAQGECGITLPRGNPVDAIRKPADGKARDRRLTADEWAKLEQECQASRNVFLWPALRLSVETAMRQGELLSLEWKDIDRRRRVALLRDPDKIKNQEPRGVPLSSAALAALADLEKQPRDIKGRVFPVDRMTLYHAFMYAMSATGI